MRRIRHSSASAAPVVTAILGMFPSAAVRGRRVWFLSVIALFVQVWMVGIVICRRHLPICMTTGTLVVDGTGSSVIVKRPCVSVSADAYGAVTWAPQRSQLTPLAIAGSGPLGT